ncbi:MAG: hypothetical protein Q9163_000010 [Psora crenata]
MSGTADKRAFREPDQGFSRSIAPEPTLTPRSLQNPRLGQSKDAESPATPTRLAGTIGLATGLGALISLLVFLRLPYVIEQRGANPSQALSYSYYIVGTMAIILSIACFFGLSHLRGEDEKGWKRLLSGSVVEVEVSRRSYKLFKAVKLGFENHSLGLAYLGGFVARASSVGISTFIPLFVNSYYISSGYCDADGHDLEDVREHCRGAYVLSAKLTGVSQTAALVFAIVFGISAEKWRRFNAPQNLAALVGLIGYIALAILNTPETGGQDGNPFVYLIMVMLGISQIGAIVCSLGLLGRCVLGMENVDSRAGQSLEASSDSDILDAERNEADESNPLIPKVDARVSYEDMKGTIAGVYSLAGGIGILLLTKVGGLLFDRASTAAPFYILAIFNGILVLAGVLDAILGRET